METITRFIGLHTIVADIHFALSGCRALLDTDMIPSWWREAGVNLVKLGRFNFSSPAGQLATALKAIEAVSSVVKSSLDSVLLLRPSAWLRQHTRGCWASLRAGRMP